VALKSLTDIASKLPIRAQNENFQETFSD
jgi:hypothetical protein